MMYQRYPVYRRLLVSHNYEYIVWLHGLENNISNESMILCCQEFIEISRRIAEHASDMVKGERENAKMFEIN